MSFARIPISEVKLAATGRWREILAVVGGCDGALLNGTHHPCPKCGGTDRFRAYNDVDETGGVICNQCFSTDNSDGLKTIKWLRGIGLRESVDLVGEYLGLRADSPTTNAKPKPTATTDILATVSRLKRMPLESFKAFGAAPAKRGKITVARVPMFNELREQCSHFDLADASPELRKGLSAKGKKVGLFVAAWPEPEQTILITEGVKDAAALHGLGFLAIGLPGSELAAKFARVFKDCNVIIVPDRDITGEAAANVTAARLASIAATVRVATLPSELKEKDGDGVREILARNNGEQLLRQAIADAREWRPEDHPEVADLPPNEADNDPHRLARLFVEQNSIDDQPIIRFWRGVWYLWHDGYYDPLDAEEIRCRVVACMKAEFDRVNIERLREYNISATEDKKEKPPQVLQVTVSNVGSVLQALRAMLLLPSSIDPPSLLAEDGLTAKPAKHLVSLRNGVLNLKKFLSDAEDILEPHSPSLFTLAALPVDFDPQAECPLWMAFLARNLANDDRCDMLQEWFGICATFNNSFQSFLLLEGEGSNGKSVICSALTALLGLRNVSHVPLECFGETFHLSGTIGKLANVVSEIGEVEKANEGTLKSYTSGDRMTFNRKNLPLFEAVPTARLVMSTNKLPHFADRSNGVWRRMLLLPLTAVIAPAERVAGMDSTEWWGSRPGELSGVLLWALAGLARLMQAGRFTQPAASIAGIAEYQLDCFPARRFLTDNYEVNADGEVSTYEMYQCYRKWSEDHGYKKPQASHTFGREIKKVFPTAKPKRWVRRHDGKLGPGYTGIEVQLDPVITPESDGEKKEKKSETLF